MYEGYQTCRLHTNISSVLFLPFKTIGTDLELNDGDSKVFVYHSVESYRGC